MLSGPLACDWTAVGSCADKSSVGPSQTSISPRYSLKSLVVAFDIIVSPCLLLTTTQVLRTKAATPNGTLRLSRLLRLRWPGPVWQPGMNTGQKDATRDQSAGGSDGVCNCHGDKLPVFHNCRGDDEVIHLARNDAKR